MQEYIEHTDESYKRTIALLREEGDDYAAILTERLWVAQRVIKELQAAPPAPDASAPDPCACGGIDYNRDGPSQVYTCYDCGAELPAPDASADDVDPFTPQANASIDWGSLSVGYCDVCSEGHALVNGKCYDCRPPQASAEECDHCDGTGVIAYGYAAGLRCACTQAAATDDSAGEPPCGAVLVTCDECDAEDRAMHCP